MAGTPRDRRRQEAATAEFAEHGPDGTTMARIAGRAGINKERLYRYFGDKQALFETVLTAELEKLAASVELPAGGLEDIGEFAGRTFDYHAAHPSSPACCYGRDWPTVPSPTRRTAPPTTRTRRGPTRPPSAPASSTTTSTPITWCS